MKKTLSLFIAITFFSFAQTSILAQKATPSAALETPKATVSATLKAVTKTSSPTAAPVTVNKVLTSMPKVSFVMLVLVLLFLIVEMVLLKKKKSEEENVSKVTAETFKETAGGDKKTKILLTVLILVFILIAIPLTLILVKQRQEVRKKAVEPTVCCRIMARNLCGTTRSFDLFVRNFATEAECDAYLQHPEPQSYSCNCSEECYTGPGCVPPDRATCSGHDGNQTCTGGTACNNLCGKSRCTTSGSADFRKEIVNQSACGGVATAPPTAAPTTAPTRAPTTPPTAAPTTAPTRAPTTPPTAAPTRAPTAPPTTAPTSPPITLSCNQGPCNVSGSGCTSGLTCIHDTWFGHDQWVCRNSDCQIESDCICKQAQNTPGPTPPPNIGAPGQTSRPYVPLAQGAASTPTIPVPVIPQAGIDAPTFMTVAAGAILLIVGLALAL